MKLKKYGLLILVLSMLLTSSFSLRYFDKVEAVSTSQSGGPSSTETPGAGDSSSILVKVYYTDLKSYSDILISFDSQIIETNYEEMYHVLELTKTEIERLREAGYQVVIDPEIKVWIPEVGIQTIPGYSCYRTVEETFATASAIASNYPNLAEWIDVGDSWEKSVGQSDGYDMMVLRLTNELIPGEKPALFITGAIHAREYVTAELATRFAEYLVTNYNVDPDVTWLLDYNEVHLMLHINPDGRKEAEAGSSWRKNTNENYCGVTSSNRGADLNRNFTYMWDCCGGSSDSPCDATYHGASAGSEPEVQAAMNYMRSIIPDRRGSGLTDPAPLDTSGIYIDLHSYGGLILWPWGFTNTVPPNGVGMQTLGRKWGYFNGYTPRQAIGLYPTDGASKDFAYGELGIPGYTIELGTAFFQSCSTFTGTILPNNIPVLLYAAKAVRTPYMIPAGPDVVNLAVSSNTVPAGGSVTLTASINDTRYNNSNGTEPTQTISTAAYYVDLPPWADGASGINLSASDGSFNSTVENVTGIINTSGWSQGRHIIYVQGGDVAGNWGAVSAIFLTVEGQANQAPVISQGDSVSVVMSEDGNPSPFAVSIDAVDPDGNPLSWSLLGLPAHGTAEVSGSGASPTITYAPTANYNGTDSFVVQVSDGSLTDAITVNVTIQPVNDVPVANAQSVSTSENTAKAITLSGSDVDGDALTYTIVSQPAHGTLSGTGSSQTYTPASNYNGSDNFTFKVNDGTVDSNTATVSITVTSVNDAPVANEQAVSTAEDTAKAITLTGSDADGDTLTYSIVAQPAHGTLSGSAPIITYTPNSNYNGSDSFSFKINDGSVDSNNATVTITVTPVNDAPVALPQNVGTIQDTPVSITLSGSDIDTDPLTYTISVAPTHGTLSGTAPDLTYTPNSGYVGADSFEFTVSDGTATSSPALVSISVNNVNDAPVANGQSLSTAEDTALSITLSGSDADNDPLAFQVITQPAHGTLTGSAPALTFEPEANYNGTDSFTFVVNDGTVDSAPATVTIDITPVNDAPVANPQELTTAKDTALTITMTGSDIEGSTLSFTVQSGPSSGTLTGSGASRVYTPNAGFIGDDSFTFVVNDGNLDSEPATIGITVTRTNEPPIATGQSLSTNEDVPLGVVLTGSDPDGDTLTFSVTGEPSHGSLSGTAPSLTYTPSPNYRGNDSFSFVVNDGLVDSADATVAITVIPVNDDPVADSQSVIVVEDNGAEITLNGSDIDGDALTYTVVTQPSHGSLSGTGSNQTYTPAANYNGPDSFTFKVNDGTLDSNTATVTITVTAENDAPVASGQTVSTAEDTAKPITLTGSDADGNPLTYSIVTQPSHGVLSSSAPNVTYTPAANYNGSDSFTFKVNDGQTDSAPATVSITVSPVNDAPMAIPQSLTIDEDTSLDVILSGSDVDGDSLTLTLVTEPTHGTLSGTVPNLVYTSISNYNGSDSFTFSVSDGTLVSGAAVIAITILPVNDLPIAVGQAVTTSENLPVSITLVGSDVDGDPINYIINNQPEDGVLTGTVPNLTYTPNNYYSGNDVFSFYVWDGQSNSNSAEVTILILDRNYLPIVFNQSLLTSENSPLLITLTGMDPDGDMISFFTKAQPEHGVLTGTAPNLIYTPDPGYTGSDSFTFAASDQVGESNEGVISIQINPSGPLIVFFDDFETDLGWVRNPDESDTATLGWFERANPDSVLYNGDKQLGTTVSGSYDLVTGPLAGSSAGAYDLDGGMTSFLSPTIQIPAGRELTLSFSYYLSHYTNSSTADYLRVFIIGNQTVKIFEELGANNDDDAVWAAFSGDMSSFAGQTVRILIEAADASTASYFEAAIDDVLIVASTPNNPPIAESKSYEMGEDASLLLTLSGSDPEGAIISYQVASFPSHGTLVGAAPNVTFVPAENYHGTDKFTFITNDGKLNSEPASISLTVTAVNDAPIAADQNVSTTLDVPLGIILIGTDIEGDSLTYTLLSSPTHGGLSGTVPNLVYTPSSGYVGTDSFQFKVNDGHLDSASAQVSITVNPAGPVSVFWDDFESNKGWVVNPNGVDTATSGTWVRANPETVSYNGYKQLGTTMSGSYDLVTGPLAGSSSGSYDLDGGLTSIRSPLLNLPVGRNLTLSFSYYLAHYTNSSTADYLRIKVIGNTTTTIFQELGANNDDDASWQTFSISLNNYAGQSVYLLIEATDASSASLVEAAVDDVLIIAE